MNDFDNDSLIQLVRKEDHRQDPLGAIRAMIWASLGTLFIIGVCIWAYYGWEWFNG